MSKYLCRLHNVHFLVVLVACIIEEGVAFSVVPSPRQSLAARTTTYRSETSSQLSLARRRSPANKENRIKNRTLPTGSENYCATLNERLNELSTTNEVSTTTFSSERMTYITSGSNDEPKWKCVFVLLNSNDLDEKSTDISSDWFSSKKKAKQDASRLYLEYLDKQILLQDAKDSLAVKEDLSTLIPPPSSNDNFIGMASYESDEEAANSNKEIREEENDGYVESDEEVTDSTKEVKRKENDGNNDDGRMAKKVIGRKKRVIVGYTLTSGLYLLITSIAILLLNQKKAAVSFIAYFSSGSILASGLAFIQKGAAENDRLRSDTYKRLNVFMAWHGFLMTIVAANIMSSPALLIVTNLIAMINSIKGYGYGARGWTLQEGVPFMEDLTKGVKGTVQSMIGGFPSNMKSAGYFLGTAVACSLKLSKSVEVGKALIQSSGSITLLVGSRLHRCSKLGLLSVCMYTLKDAADRDRLNGTTFIQLNILSSLVWASMASYIFQQQPVALLGTKYVLRPSIMASLAGFLALFTAGNGLISIAEKKKA